FKRSLADRGAAFHQEVVLHSGEAELFSQLLQLRAGGVGGRGGSAESIAIKAGAVSSAAGSSSAVAESDGNRAIGLAGDAPDGTPNAAAVNRDLNAIFVVEIVVLRGLFADHDGIVPGKAGDRTRQLLQPGIVRIAAVEDIGVGMERNFEAGSSRSRLRG